MAAFNFKKRFAAMVERGDKCQTIRAERKDGRRPHNGETLYLYTGMRTKACRKLLEAACRSVEEVKIFRKMVVVSGSRLKREEVVLLAKADGFENVEKFFEFFSMEHGLPFRGLLIKWNPLK